MADDITLNAGAGGSVVATDEVSSRHFQKMKLTYGADGTATDVTATAGLPTAPGAATSGGCSLSKLISAATTNETEVKGTPGQVYAIYATNINAAIRYMKVYNDTAANVTVGTTTPVLTLPVPGNQAGAGFFISVPNGITFSAAITYALTTGVADNDTGAVAANELTVSVFYK